MTGIICFENKIITHTSAKMKTPRRCLKFTGWIYMPDENDDWDELRNYALKTMGNIQLFDEQNKRIPGRLEPFDNLGQMLDTIMSEYKKRAINRVPTQKQKKAKTKP